MNFEWDNLKADSNYIKHGVSFEEAMSVFADDFARLKFDSKNSMDEDRYVLLGISTSMQILTVVFAEIIDESIRIISARKATKSETMQYWRLKG